MMPGLLQGFRRAGNAEGRSIAAGFVSTAVSGCFRRRSDREDSYFAGILPGSRDRDEDKAV
jgi:hypothetical protein